MKNFKGILVLGERNIFGELSQIISFAAQANAILKVMFKNSSNDQLIAENMHAIKALEKKSDEIAFKISEDITCWSDQPQHNRQPDRKRTCSRQHCGHHFLFESRAFPYD